MFSGGIKRDRWHEMGKGVLVSFLLALFKLKLYLRGYSISQTTFLRAIDIL